MFRRLTQIRHRWATMCGAAPLAAASVLLMSMVSPATASAYFFSAFPPDADLTSGFAYCVYRFNLEDGSGDPAWVYRPLLASPVQVTIAKEPHTPPYGSFTTPDSWFNAQNGLGSPSTIDWDPLDHGRPIGPELAPQDKCAALYHEMQHALDFSLGQWDGRNCAATDHGPDRPQVSISEVKATLAENQYRRYHGIPERTTYNGLTLPFTLQDCYR